MKAGYSLCMMMGLVLGGISGSAEQAESMNSELAELLFSDLGASKHDCPDAVVHTLRRDQAAQCASLEMDFKGFKKRLRQALKRLDGYKVREVRYGSGHWSRMNDNWSKRFFLANGIPTWVAFSEKDSGLMVVRGWLPLSCPGPEEATTRPAFDVDKNPELIQSTYVSPDMPRSAPMQPVEVVLNVRIGADGVPEVLCALHAEPQGQGFEEAAAAAIQQWRYEPAQKDGKPVAASMSVVVNWN